MLRMWAADPGLVWTHKPCRTIRATGSDRGALCHLLESLSLVRVWHGQSGLSHPHKCPQPQGLSLSPSQDPSQSL